MFEKLKNLKKFSKSKFVWEKFFIAFSNFPTKSRKTRFFFFLGKIFSLSLPLEKLHRSYFCIGKMPYVKRYERYDLYNFSNPYVRKLREMHSHDETVFG